MSGLNEDDMETSSETISEERVEDEGEEVIPPDEVDEVETPDVASTSRVINTEQEVSPTDGQEKRPRKQTEKGLAYKLEQKIKAYRQLQSQLHKHLDKLNLRMINPEVKSLKSALADTIKCKESFEVETSELEDMLSIEEFDHYCSATFKFLLKVTKAVESARRSATRIEQPDDKSSVHSSRKSERSSVHSSRRSEARSHGTLGSRTSQLRMERLDEQKTAAELKAKLQFQKKGNQKRLEMEQKRLEMELLQSKIAMEKEQLETEEKLAILEARDDVHRKVERESVLDVDDDLPDLCEESNHEKVERFLASADPSDCPDSAVQPQLLSSTSHPKLSPNENMQSSAQRTVSQGHPMVTSLPTVMSTNRVETICSVSNETNPVWSTPKTNGLASMSPYAGPISNNVGKFSAPIQDQKSNNPIATYQIPGVKVDKFSGDIFKFQAWEAAFDTLLETAGGGVALKLNLLSQHLSGEPSDLVGVYFVQQSEDAYQNARSRLKSRYGNSVVISKAFTDKLSSWPRINNNQPVELQKFTDFLLEICTAKQKMDCLKFLDFPHETTKILERLPVHLVRSWRKLVFKWCQCHDLTSYPPFEELVRFLKSQSDQENIPQLQGLKLYEPRRQQQQQQSHAYRRRTANTTASKDLNKNIVQSSEAICTFCEGSHNINDCIEIMKIPIDERKTFLFQGRLCFACGCSTGHKSKDCPNRAKCQRCNKRHLTALHRDRETHQGTINCIKVCSIVGQSFGTENAMIVPVWIRNRKKPSKEMLSYSILDCQSNVSLLSNSVRKQLGLTGSRTNLTLSTVTSKNAVLSAWKLTDVDVLSYDRSVCVPIPCVFTRNEIPSYRSQIPRPEIAKQWKHLEGVAKEMAPYSRTAPVAILIGTDVPQVLRPRDIVAGGEHEPYAQKSILGWGIIGVVCHSCYKKCNGVSLRIDMAQSRQNEQNTEDKTDECKTNECKRNHGALVFSNRVKEVINPHQLKQMMEVDFVEPKGKLKELSIEDSKFVQILSDNIKQRSDGHYEMPLPLRSQQIRLPNNRTLALKRVLQLQRRFKRNPKFKVDYINFMKDVLATCAERVPFTDLECNNGRVNYVPHSGVYHPKKPDKIRVVFDCSAEFEGVSLNDYLLQGPNLMNGLIGVLCRFRKEEVAVMADIKSMFHQFYVREEDRDLLRFLWWEDGNLEKNLVEYRMAVHLFGAASSPGCANFGLKRAADDGEQEFGPKAADFVREDFYVDDGLKSVQSVEDAIALINESKALCAKAGLKLHKFMSNNREVLEAVSEEDRAAGMKSLDIRVDPLPLERALGISWCVEIDAFQFRIEFKDMPCTRRGILSTVSSIYDPVGFVAPVMLEGKKILQELCRNKASWDDPVPESFRMRWEKWREQTRCLADLKIPRCVKPEDFGEVASVELHHFSDACETGYGQCSYVRLVNTKGNVHCSFIIGKARVAPLKQITIPRLELTAAVVSARISKFLRDELKYPNVKEYFWVDSKVVLGYINNEAKRFHVYVANRVQQIRDLSDSNSWFYVDSRSNPSDCASRGMDAKTFLKHSVWFDGPNFLWKQSPISSDDNEYQLDDETEAQLQQEMRKATVFDTCAVNNCNFPSYFEVSRLERFSSWHRAKRAVANCLRWFGKLKPKGSQSNPLSVTTSVKLCSDDLLCAEKQIIKNLQKEYFGEEVSVLLKLSIGPPDSRCDVKGRKTSLKCVSSLFRLDPFIDKDGLVRVGGRIEKAAMAMHVKHPVVLPRNSVVTQMVIAHYHKDVNHMGRGTTLNHIRQNGYWVIGGSSAVAQYIKKCVVCRRLRSNPQVQKMADLPDDRLSEEPPFTFSAADFFGPFYIKEKRSMLKRYGVVFTCMSSRAVHLETANSLETDSFINAMRRFLARRGPTKQLRSDCGTNFVGASNELQKACKEMDFHVINDFLLKQNCDWFEPKFNVPSSSHMGGVWERQIRTVRNALEPLLARCGTQLDDEAFRTFMTEVENIVNSRPLTTNHLCDPEFPEPLTPNHLLTMKPKLLLSPPGKFQHADVYARHRWRRVQHLANEFWLRWRTEFLNNLQSRTKWASTKRNLKPGDVVILRDHDSCRNEWPLARVESVYPSDDGLIRKVRLRIGDHNFNSKGERVNAPTFFDRPVHKLVLLVETDDEDSSKMTV